MVVSKPEPEGPEPPADAKKALMDMGASFKVSSTVKEWWVGWKNPRLDGTDPQVRRVCILTDSNIFLLNENYVGDGSRSSFIAYKGGFGDVALDLVDSAQLSQVSDIRAADEDPKQITLVITTSRIARSHRWRLVCSNGDSAEQLIADLRRAVAMVQ